MIQEDPARVRQLLLQSGLSEDEIRARLASMGYPPTILDEFLAGGGIDSDEAQAAITGLERLGVIPLKKGRGKLTLRALEIPSRQVADVRYVVLTLRE